MQRTIIGELLWQFGFSLFGYAMGALIMYRWHVPINIVYWGIGIGLTMVIGSFLFRRNQ